MSATMNKAGALERIFDEGHGPTAWHGNNLRAAIDNVSPELAFRRPGKGRHNIAEIALHHAFVIRNVRAQLTGSKPEPFILDGEDWFVLDDQKTLKWTAVQKVLDDEQRKLAKLLASSSPDRLDLILGLTCHAVYHAGQIQLIKVLAGDR